MDFKQKFIRGFIAGIMLGLIVIMFKAIVCLS